jgi:hypothetical protein
MFRRLEHFLERLVEAPAGRLGAATQPVTLGKRIERAMDTNKRFSGEGVIVPNRYVLHLNPADYASFEAYHGSLEDDLAHDALTRARRLGYRLLARPTVVLESDNAVPRGEVRVAASVADAAEATPDPAIARSETSVIAGRATVPGMDLRARLPRSDRWRAWRPGGGAVIAIGRGADNDVIVDDPRSAAITAS